MSTGTDKHFRMFGNQYGVFITHIVQTALGAQARNVYTIAPDNQGIYGMETVYEGSVLRTAQMALHPQISFEVAGTASGVDRTNFNRIFLGAEMANIAHAQLNGVAYWWSTGVGRAELMMTTGTQPAVLVFSASWTVNTGLVLPGLPQMPPVSPVVHIRMVGTLDLQVQIAAFAAIWLKMWGIRRA